MPTQRLAPAARPLVAVLLLGLFAAAMWHAWLGWDHSYYEVDGVPQGPYRAWQVVGCGACIVVATLATYTWLRTTSAIVAAPAAAVVGFAIPWSIDASSDASGLWVVGLVMILVGGGGALLVATAINAAVAPPRRRRA